jgi:hypothetical protein
MAGINFEPSINAGHILTFLGMLGGAVMIYAGMKAELAQVDYRIVQVEKTLDKLSVIIAADARQDARLEEMARRFEELSKRVERAERAQAGAK